MDVFSTKKTRNIGDGPTSSIANAQNDNRQTNGSFCGRFCHVISDGCGSFGNVLHCIIASCCKCCRRNTAQQIEKVDSGKVSKAATFNSSGPIGDVFKTSQHGDVTVAVIEVGNGTSDLFDGETKYEDVLEQASFVRKDEQKKPCDIKKARSPRVFDYSLASPRVEFTFPNEKYIMSLWNKLDEETRKLRIDYLDSRMVTKRFHEIGCPTESAIVVGDTILHANIVGGEHVGIRQFIASQAPIAPQSRYRENTDLFWRLAFDQRLTIIDLTHEDDIIDLTNQDDIDKKKDGVVPYYPEKVDESRLYGLFEVTLNWQDDQEWQSWCKYSVKDTETDESRDIFRLHNYSWKDFTAVSLNILEMLVDVLSKIPENSNILIHCRAGVGRTGTLIGAYGLWKLINEGVINQDNFEESLLNFILKLRWQRGENFVQQPAQLGLLYEYGMKLLGFE